MNIAKDLDQALLVIEKHITPIAKETFELLVKQNFIEGIISTSILFTFFFASVFGLIRVYKNKEKIFEEMDGDFIFMIVIVLIIIIIICILVLCISGGEFILKIFNPKYYAILDLINLAK